jgi:hypothetical protein
VYVKSQLPGATGWSAGVLSISTGLASRWPNATYAKPNRHAADCHVDMPIANKLLVTLEDEEDSRLPEHGNLHDGEPLSENASHSFAVH